MGFAAQLVMADVATLKALGGPVTYTPGTGSAVVVTGIFDRAYVRDLAGEVGISAGGPMVFLRLADLPSDPSTDTAARVTAAGVVYKPVEVQPDGLGGVLLKLHEVV